MKELGVGHLATFLLLLTIQGIFFPQWIAIFYFKSLACSLISNIGHVKKSVTNCLTVWDLVDSSIAMLPLSSLSSRSLPACKPLIDISNHFILCCLLFSFASTFLALDPFKELYLFQSMQDQLAKVLELAFQWSVPCNEYSGLIS